MKQILTIINQSENEKALVTYMKALAVDLNAKLHLLHIQVPDSYFLATAGTTGVASAELYKKLEAHAEDVRQRLWGYANEPVDEKDIIENVSSEVGSVKMVVDDIISKNNIDMIAIESPDQEKGFAGEELVMDVIRNVHLPAWIIPQNGVYQPPTKIIYATDYKEEDISALKRLVDQTKQWLPNITALNISNKMDYDEKVRKTGFAEMLRT